MISIPNYRVEQELYASESSVVVRARRESDGLAVVIKLLRDEYPGREALARLRREHAILKALSVPEVPKAMALEQVGSSLALVMEDSGGEPVDAVARRSGFAPSELLRLAVAIVRAVRAIHAQRVIHKDLKPQHMLLGALGVVQIIDFGISSELAQERCLEADPDALEGTLAYLAPEQTGRMGRSVDRRSDLYALGVSLFELATGQLPFAAGDPLELVHCHIAKSAPRADALRPGVPAMVASVIEKLMAKSPEDRYQSAAGLLADLERCRAQFQATGAIEPFELGADDLSDSFQVPQKLYGRAGALAVLQSTFDRACGGAPQVLLVSGPSGIGKSALVLELRRQLARRGRLVSGKFDPLSRSEPYSALVAACRELVRAVLRASPTALQAKRRALLDALGANARLIIDLVPELELVVGPQAQPAALGPGEARARFEQAFESFLSAMVPSDEPLALFLDDLQWADASSLRLVGRIALGLHRPILVVGAYRDGEVSGMHPLLLEVAELARSGAAITRLRLNPLGPDEIAELLSDALRRPAPEVRTLAAVLLEKTRGNPFHLGQFLAGLFRDGLLHPDAASRRWGFDLVAIEGCRIAANAADLVLERLRALAPDAQQLLGLGACIGHEFDSQTMALIAELDRPAQARGLTAALREGALIPLDERYRYLAQPDAARELNARFRFAHDRVQQASYALIDEGQRRAVHLRIGRLLRGGLGETPGEEQLFAVAQQMNRGIHLLSDPAERDWLAELNLRCAHKAQVTGASALALEHVATALSLLGERGWFDRYAIAFAARMAQAEGEYVSGRPERALAVLDDVDAHAREVLDQVAAENLRTAVYVRLNRIPEGCRTGAAALRRLGVEVPAVDDKAGLGAAIAAEAAALQGLLRGRDVASLTRMSEMSDPLDLAKLRTMTGLIPAAYQAIPELHALTVLKATRLTLERGATDLTSFILGQYAIVHLAMTGDHAAAYDFGKLGLEVGLSRANLAAVGPAHFLFGGFIGHWRDPIARSVEHLGLGLRRCLELGDTLHAAYCVGLSALYQIHAGVPLPEVRAALPAAVEMVERLGDRVNRAYLDVCDRLIDSLSGECEPSGPAGAGIEAADLSESAAPVSYWLSWARGMVRFHAGRFDSALTALGAEFPLPGMVGVVDGAFYSALSHAALARAGASVERERHRRSLAEVLERFERWAALSPANHAHRRALLAAEKADLDGDGERALDLYEEAIAGAKSQGFLQNHALALELCGEFHFSARRARLAQTCLAEAVLAYERWGAKGKARQLAARHADLDLGPGGGDPAGLAGAGPLHRKTTTVGKSTSAALDLESAMRATQAMASELQSDKLLDQLLRILVENAGAQRGVLIAPRGDELVVEAERTVEPDEVRLRNGAPLSSAEVPEQVVRYVARTREPVALGDAAADAGSFAEDLYWRAGRARSALCVALLHQGRLAAVLYLENRAAAHAFSPARVARLQFLAAHAAAALANSRLYEQVQAARRELEERVQARTLELSQRNGDLKNVFDAVGQGLLTLDREGRVVGEVSAAAVSWFGPLAEGSSWSAALARVDPGYGQAFAAAFAQAVRGGAPHPALLREVPRRMALRGRALDLELRPIGGEATWARMLVVISDVTDEERGKRLELELRHAQKLEAVGQLAAGIAHEINTPAQFVGDNLAFLAESFREAQRVLSAYRGALPTLAAAPGGEALAQSIAQAEQEADLAYIEENAPAAFERAKEGISRISTLVSAMKEFAHPDRREKDLADLNRALRTTLTIARNETKYVADVEEELGDLPPVKCHLSDINQVFLNLLVNAAHAIGEVVAKTGGRGRIRVQTARQGDSVRISIEDTGCGIREEIRDRVFDPFFTTKPVGKGTGQGLAIARSIVVDKHGGTLSFESEVGRGTTFTLVLPVDGGPGLEASPAELGAPKAVPAAR